MQIEQQTEKSKPARKKSRAQLFQVGKDKPRLTDMQKRAGLRAKHLSWIYFDKYPRGLPHNKIGVNFAKYMVRTMAFLPDDRRAQWLDRHAPWLDPATRDYFLRLGPYWYNDRSLGHNIELDDADRERLQVWTIEARDVSYEERQEINRAKDRKRKEKRRRKDGARPRDQSISGTKPWLAAGYRCRRTWERHGKPVANSSAPSLISNTKDELATNPESTASTGHPVLAANPAGNRPDNILAFRQSNATKKKRPPLLQWCPGLFALAVAKTCDPCARYLIRKVKDSDTVALRFKGDVLGSFATIEEAKQSAQRHLTADYQEAA
jgi:hypothetical protein